MTPPDADLKRQRRRHRWPLLGLALVVLIGVGVILFWIGEEVVTAPAPEIIEEDDGGLGEATELEELQEGDVEVPQAAPTFEASPETQAEPAAPADQ